MLGMYSAVRQCAIAAFAVVAYMPSEPLHAADATTSASTTAAAAVDPVAASPWASARGNDQYGTWADLTVKGVVQRFRLIPAGTFTMGSPSDEVGRNRDETAHSVTLTKPYWMADSDCTQALWQVVMGSNPAYFIGNPQRPVEQVSWDDCQQMLAALNKLDARLSARLPTEAEWEYACRAGTTGPIPGVSLDAMAWDRDNSGNTTHPVKEKAPNSWGLYDMIGNVLQWCGDRYGDYPTGPLTDPVGSALDSERVYRGGDWDHWPSSCRSAYRYHLNKRMQDFDLGFRICLPVQTESSQRW